VNWLECPDRTQRESPSGDLTSYGVRFDVQRLLAGIRTDLDSFSNAEADALMFSAYKMTTEAANSLSFMAGADSPEEQWRFLGIAPIAGAPQVNDEVASLRKTLTAAAELAFKPFRVMAPVTVHPAVFPAVTVLAVLAAVLLLPGKAWHVGVSWKPVLIAALAYSGIELLLRRVIKYRGSLLQWLFALVCIPGSILLEAYLRTVERIYIDSGPKYRQAPKGKATAQAAGS
jgi:hypothetical protein